MSFFDWNESYATGIQVIDGQHKKLFELVSTLHTAMTLGHGHQKLGEILGELEEYTRVHFTDEEKLMEAHVYPGLVAHHREHAEFKERLGNLRQQYALESSGLSIPAMRMLKEWLTTHVKGTDQKYAPFLKAKGVS
jgi:hemerythrin